MKMRYLFLASALCAVGCARSNDRPPSDPSAVEGTPTSTASPDSTINPSTSHAGTAGAESGMTTTMTTTTPTAGESTGSVTEASPPSNAHTGGTNAMNGGARSNVAPAARKGPNNTAGSAAGASAQGAAAPTPAPAAATTGQSDTHAADGTAAATNTKINERDRNPSNLTPMSQGNSKEELRITQAIRKSVMADKGLSFNAKNVKIITVGTKVTLRGPVASEQEKSAIASRAKQTPGVTDVDDQLEVKK